MSTKSNPAAATAPELQRIVYASAASHVYAEEQLERLLSKARESNRRSGITGMLVYHEQSFLQLIEGPGTALNSLFARLRSDQGHHRVVLLLRERVAARSFADAPMGFAQLTNAELQGIPEMADFLERRMTLQGLTPRRAVRFLTAFRDCRVPGSIAAGVPEC
jgi:hypothetical protein